jgi:hypothetical protein
MDQEDRVLMSSPVPGHLRLCRWKDLKGVDLSDRTRVKWGHIGHPRTGQIPGEPAAEGDGLPMTARLGPIDSAPVASVGEE